MPSTNKNKKITIDTVGGEKDKTQLDNCYFRQDEAPATTYTFYSKGNVALATGITSGTVFSFSFADNPHVTWQITPTIIPDTSASGPWSNNDPTIDADESGTWTAQATPEEEEDGSAASAGA